MSQVKSREERFIRIFIYTERYGHGVHLIVKNIERNAGEEDVQEHFEKGFGSNGRNGAKIYGDGAFVSVCRH